MAPSILKRDSWVIGLLMGLVIPIISYGILISIDVLLFNILGIHLTREHHLLYLLSLIGNLFPIRHYLVSLKFEKSGFGVLISTIAIVLVYFFLYYQPQQ